MIVGRQLTVLRGIRPRLTPATRQTLRLQTTTACSSQLHITAEKQHDKTRKHMAHIYSHRIEIFCDIVQCITQEVKQKMMTIDTMIRYKNGDTWQD